MQANISWKPMKTHVSLATLPLLFCVSLMLGQGTVALQNTPATLVSAGAAGQGVSISSLPGSYFFGLLIAPPGSRDPSLFAFTGVYSTNSGPAFPGRFIGAPGILVPVPGWAPGTFMSILVAGWSASLGHDWQQPWMGGSFADEGYFGLSSIGLARSGDPGVPPLSPTPLFGGDIGIQTGWNLFPVPEPSTIVLAALGGATWMLRRRAKPGNRDRPQVRYQKAM